MGTAQSSGIFQDVNAAGGVPAILAELVTVPACSLSDALTVTGKTLGENLAYAERRGDECIRPIDSPHSQRRAQRAVRNLALEGLIIKVGGAADQRTRWPSAARRACSTSEKTPPTRW